MAIRVCNLASSVLSQALVDSGVGAGRGLRLEKKGRCMVLTLDSPRESDHVFSQGDRVVLMVDRNMERTIGDATVDVDRGQGRARLVIRRSVRQSKDAVAPREGLGGDAYRDIYPEYPRHVDLESCTGGEPMSVEQNRATLTRMYEEVYNKGELSLAPQLIAPDYYFGDLRGPDGWKQAVTNWRTAFPDVHFAVDQAICEADWIAYRLSIQGTFKGRWQNMEPTGKQVNFTLAFFSQFKDGKLFTSTAFTDPNVYQKLGSTPPGT